MGLCQTPVWAMTSSFGIVESPYRAIWARCGCAQALIWGVVPPSRPKQAILGPSHGSACLRWGVTLVSVGSVGTEGKWFRELDTEALVAPACGQATRQWVLAQIQICQALELAQLGRQRR